MRDFSVSICKRCGERPCRIDCLDTYSRANGKRPNSVTPPTVEELRKRRAPAAVKAAMGCVEASEDLSKLQRLRENYKHAAGSRMAVVDLDATAVLRAFDLALDVKRDALKHGLETLEDIGRELDE